MTESIAIRAAITADIPGLCRLAEELVRQHVAYDPRRYQPPTDVAAAYADLFAKQIGQPEAVVVVADLSGELVGYVLCIIEPPSLVALTGRAGWIHDIYVSPAARGHGAGGQLLDAAIAGLRSIGCPGGILLGVAAQNAAGAALFQRRGFRPTLQEMTLSDRLADNPT